MLKKIYIVLLHAFALIGIILVGGYFAVKFGITKTAGIVDQQTEHFRKAVQENPPWAKGEEWEALEAAILKDEKVIKKAAKDVDISPRLLVAALVPEQLRLFHSDRELFKKIFYPLKILGNQSQFSWGIMGIKKETAIAIEKNLKDVRSEFYPGKKYENLLDFETADHDTERFQRIIDEKDHYYTYLYAALYLKEVEAQWREAGFDISQKPEILATLYNIGFAKSKPNASPQSGGSAIAISGATYSFGGLAGEFYDSNELADIFPR